MEYLVMYSLKPISLTVIAVLLRQLKMVLQEVWRQVEWPRGTKWRTWLKELPKAAGTSRSALLLLKLRTLCPVTRASWRLEMCSQDVGIRQPYTVTGTQTSSVPIV
uniref:Putative secreted protein n=1 Tax=Anopheles darlingi TaxID=43151 RepID=A0A2M4DLJ7_ANODA